MPVAVAGNVGTALTLARRHARPGRRPWSARSSSFQLEDTVEFAPEGAVLLNLAPDHLDRHGTFEAYRAAKLRVFAHQGNDDVAVAPLGLGVEDLGGCARRVCFGDGPQAELSDRAGQLWWDDEPLIAVEEIACAGAQPPQRDGGGRGLPGARRSSPTPCAPALRTFAGVEHRLEEVATIDGVALRQRLQGHQRRLDARRARELRRAGPPDPRRRGKGQDFAPLRAPWPSAAPAST